MVGVTSLSDFWALVLISRCLVYNPALSATSSVTGALWKSFDGLSPADQSSASFMPVRGQCALECQRRSGCQGFFYNDVSKMCVRMEVTAESDFVESSSIVSGFRYYTSKHTCPSMTTTTELVHAASSSCFVVNDTPKLKWTEARDRCYLTGGQLAVLDTRGKVDFIMNIMHNNSAYISARYNLGARRPMEKWGASWPASGQDFVWLNGQPLDLTVAGPYWMLNEPNNWSQKENAIQLFAYSRQWIDGIDVAAGYICQYSLL